MRPYPWITRCLSAAGLLVLLLTGLPLNAADIENCLMCHRHRFIGRIDENGKQWNYNVDETLYNGSIHRRVACRSCHTSIQKIPHDPIKQPVDCATQCHIKPPFAADEFSHQKIIALYDRSAHHIDPNDPEAGKKSNPACKFCHQNPPYDTIAESQVPFEKTVRRCYNCHRPGDALLAYQHITHRLRKRTTRSPQEIVALCAKCHRKDSLIKTTGGTKEVEVVESYNRSIHGKSVRLGSTQAADCLACHASSALHDIFKRENPRASINKANIAKTCEKCHDNVNRWFIQIAVHPGMQTEKNPVVAGAGMVFRFILYGSVFGMLGLMLMETFGRRKEGIHLLLRNGSTWIRRSIRGSGRHPRPPEAPARSGRRNHPGISYAIGAVFILLSLVVLAGIIHHLTISSHGPGLLRPLWNRYAKPPHSEILTEARRQKELEQHRHFHQIAPEVPRWPENLRPACFICHSDFPHTKNKKIRSLMNIHTQFLVCETCHIKLEPGAAVVYRWYDPTRKNPKGPFYGTSYDPETGSLSKGKDLIAKIAPFVRTAASGDFQPAILAQDAPEAKDFMKVRERLSPEMREAVKNEFHATVKPKGYDCKTCHTKDSILDFTKLGFSDTRALNLKTLSVADMLSNYEEFYIPDFFSGPKPKPAKP